MRKLPSSSDDHLEEENVNEWITGDDDLENDFFNNDQILEKVIEEASESGVADDDNEDNGEEKISHEDGKNALQLAIKYIEEQDISTAVNFMFIKMWTDYAFKKAMDNKIQKKITDYF